MTAYYLSFGCKVNQYDTNALRGMLSREGIQPVEQPEDADLILVNSGACEAVVRRQRSS